MAGQLTDTPLSEGWFLKSSLRHRRKWESEDGFQSWNKRIPCACVFESQTHFLKVKWKYLEKIKHTHFHTKAKQNKTNQQVAWKSLTGKG